MLGRLEQLTGNRRTLAGAPRQLIALAGQTVRAVGIVVLLATVYLAGPGRSAAGARAGDVG